MPSLLLEMMASPPTAAAKVTRPRTRSASKRGQSPPECESSSPEKRPKKKLERQLDVQQAKCLDYLFRLDEHAACSDELELDLALCKDCLEHLDLVIAKAKKMLAAGGQSDQAASNSQESNFSDDISSSAGSSSDTTNRAALDERRSAFKSHIRSVFRSLPDNGYDCRFVGWRKIQTNRTDCIQEYGFLELSDVRESDEAIWNVQRDPVKCLDQIKQTDSGHTANDKELIDKYSALNQEVFRLISEPFQALLGREMEAANRAETRSAWKRQMSNVRELCDVCNTAIFNGHYGCSQCGFIACLDCTNSRLACPASQEEAAAPATPTPKKERSKRSSLLLKKDRFGWPCCFRLNVKSLVFLTRDQSDRDSFNIRCLAKMADHGPKDLVYIQLIPPSILDSVHLCFKRVQEKVTNTESSVSSFTHDHLVLDACSAADELLEAFDQNWKLQKPIVFRNLHLRMNSDLWTPESFGREFGHIVVDLVNCRNHYIVQNVPMESFWKGFEDEAERLPDPRGRPMILKLKDWPNSDDFKKVLPSRFADLMDNLPVKPYTSREGFFNMASSLSDSFLKPDLGPKLYVAYSSAQIAKEGTTNLHMDISDALNLMMYVGQQQELPESDLKSTAMYQILVDCHCDQSQLDRYLRGERPGAIWHLFHPNDADTLRTFLASKVVKSKSKADQDRDPIHDQNNYIDAGMLKKLKKDFGVRAFTIVQFLGDAIFIPAGAPHQVRNLNSCIKAAEDFVSPQGVGQCLKITNQLRLLSKKHLNHEDKLQVKNILYHKMKDCLSFFECLENR